jgi:hypothetical protein
MASASLRRASRKCHHDWRCIYCETMGGGERAQSIFLCRKCRTVKSIIDPSDAQATKEA